ncbi:MAG: SRPBCC domain-containing protein [Gammaproteobacteria bacterium]|nr:SRPBCC domain-containing protein [Gammaproteobacteria bacterium]
MDKLRLDAYFADSVAELFAALATTLAFRRWASSAAARNDGVPACGQTYRFRTGSVTRSGRVVEVIRPVAISYQERLDDPPCRVGLHCRWRIEPLDDGCAVQLVARYRLNRAASLRPRHWRRRLERHFGNQFAALARALDRAAAAGQPIAPRQPALRAAGPPRNSR